MAEIDECIVISLANALASLKPRPSVYELSLVRVQVRIYDTRVPFRSVEPAVHSQPVTLVTAAKAVDGQGREMIASVDTAGIVKIWDVQTGEPVLLWTIGKMSNVS